MAPEATITCAQCGAVIKHEPTTLGPDAFCCLGCIGGGPCICDPRPGDSLVLRVGPFASQTDLLRFAARLERGLGCSTSR